LGLYFDSLWFELGDATDSARMTACWSGALGKNRLAVIWRMIPHCLTWCLWRERNLWTFEGLEMNPPELKLLFFRMLFDWTHVLGVFSFSSFQDFF
jgi:hypothetical protein